MTAQPFPTLDHDAADETHRALHAYSRVLGSWLKTCRPRRKHWWHASLRPSLLGLTTGTVQAGIGFELEIDLTHNRLVGRTSDDEQMTLALSGQSGSAIASSVREFLSAAGVDPDCIPEGVEESGEFPGYRPDHASDFGRAISAVSATLSAFRAGIREETSPIQLWPHHFDVSMLWLPGSLIPGQDPADEEYSDQQMNFGFTFGDDLITEPYFYVTAYPLPDALPKLELPAGTTWRTEGFSGAILLYRDLVERSDPQEYLLDLWNRLLTTGREHLN